VTLRGDVSARYTAEKVFKTAFERFGRVDTLVNNAGVFMAKLFMAFSRGDCAIPVDGDADFVAVATIVRRKSRNVLAQIVPSFAVASVGIAISQLDRNRPQSLRDTSPQAERYATQVRKANKSGKLTAADIASTVLDAVKQDRFYILPRGHIAESVAVRMKDIVDGRQPT
jgi:hypothetical protein